MHFVLLGIVVGLFSFYSGPTADAQSRPSDSSKAVVVEPFLQEVVLEPTDASKDFTVQITNNTSSVFTFSLSAVDFGTLNETGGLFFTGLESIELPYKYGLADWLELDKGTRSLSPGQKASVNVTLYNRNDLSPGGHYGAIFINSTDLERKSGQPNVNLRQTISPLIFAIKRGGERYDLALDSVSHSGQWFKGPSDVQLKFKNNGNTHVVPRGIVNLLDRKGGIHSRGIINESSSYILPESNRMLSVVLKKQAASPLQLIKTYKLEVNYRYDGLDRFAVKTYTVRWLNWQLLLVILALLGAVIWVIRKKYYKKLNFKKLKR